MRYRWLHAAVVCVMTGLIAGCFGQGEAGPSNQDVQNALSQLVATDYSTPAGSRSADAGAAAAARATVSHFHNLGCNPAPDYKGYLCETVYELAAPGHAQRKLTRLIRVVRTSSGWRATMQ